jgi:REP element-mobilizing transposase RayT
MSMGNVLRHIQASTSFFFLTAVTWDRRPIFDEEACKRIFCETLETARQKYAFDVMAFAIMPDHVHLILKIDFAMLSKALWAIKGLSARRIVDGLAPAGRLAPVFEWSSARDYAGLKTRHGVTVLIEDIG